MKAEVFWTRVEKVDDDDCWLWLSHSHKGYGRYGGKGAHRVAYELLVGPIPRGLELDHLCRTPLCVNPSHLEPVTRAENMRRRSMAQTHCGRGHPFNAENTYLYERRRCCRTCNARAARLSKLRREAA